MVKTGLVDLLLFLETADSKDVNQALTPQTLEPIFRCLFKQPYEAS
jgi:hypothetical protein